MSLPCPACGFLTNDEPTYGTYEICPVCRWEDDGVQLANPACGGGANGESLIEAQIAVLAEHPITETAAEGFERDMNWRPLSEAEVKIAQSEMQRKYWMNKAVCSPSDTYWNKSAD